jgi:hypothetical protein
MPSMRLRYIYFGLTLLASAVFLWGMFPMGPQVFAGSLMDHVAEYDREMVWITCRFVVYIVAIVCIWSHALFWRR